MSERRDTSTCCKDLWREAMRRRRWILRIESALQEIPVRCPAKGFGMSTRGWAELAGALRAIEWSRDLSGERGYEASNWCETCMLFSLSHRKLLQAEADRIRQILNAALIEQQMHWATPLVITF